MSVEQRTNRNLFLAILTHSPLQNRCHVTPTQQQTKATAENLSAVLLYIQGVWEDKQQQRATLVYRNNVIPQGNLFRAVGYKINYS